MRLTIDLQPEQAQLIVSCLEESFRLRMGQTLAFTEWPLMEVWESGTSCAKREAVEAAARDLIDALYPDHQMPQEAHEIADMWRVIRHQLYMAETDHPSALDVRSDKPIQLGDLPLIKVEVEP